MTIPTIRRRPFLAVAGEPLEISSNPIEAAVRFGEFAETSGIAHKWLLTSPLSSMPLPIYPQTWEPGQRRWDGTLPDLMWHPLMWLPERLASRYPTRDLDTDATILEEDDVWALRICQEMTVSGAYDPASGTWVDVLSTIGIDIDVPEDRARVQEWLDGGSDDALDGLDTTIWYENVEDPDWAVEAAMTQLWPMRVAAWALAADSLLDACEDLSDPSARGGLDISEAIWAAKNIAQFAGFSFQSMPADDEQFGGDPAWWASMVLDIEMFDGSVKDLFSGPIEAVYDRLLTVHEHFWPLMEKIADDDAEQAKQSPRA